MATIKAYTDIEQSKKLAEFLLLESADTILDLTNPDLPIIRAIPYEDSDYNNKYLNIIPCWSLSALFKVISNIFKYHLDYNGISFILTIGDFEVSNKTIVDACVEMILKLHKLNLL